MKKIFNLLLFTALTLSVFSQGKKANGYGEDVYGGVNIRQSNLLLGASGNVATSSAFEVRDTTKGILIPRLTTTQRTAVATPAQGLLIYNTTTKSLNCYIDTAWQSVGLVTSDSASIYRLVPTAGATFYCSNCTGTGVTGRVVTYIGGAWRRLKYD